MPLSSKQIFLLILSSHCATGPRVNRKLFPQLSMHVSLSSFIKLFFNGYLSSSFPIQMRKQKILQAISVNKECCSHQAITLQLPRWCALRGLRMRKHWILAIDSRVTHQGNDFTEAGLWHLLIQKKNIKFLKKYLIFFS